MKWDRTKKKCGFHKAAQQGKDEPMFKLCKNCGQKWATREDFLNDTDIILVGYQAHFEELTLGLFLFNHICKTTLSLPAEEFTDLYNGPVFSEWKTGKEECPGHCLKSSSLDPCVTKCEGAYIRETIQIIKSHQIVT